MSDEKFLEEYERLLDKDYCNCNEMNCIDNNAPRRILDIVKKYKEQLEQKSKVIEEAIEKIEQLRMEKWSITGMDIMNLLDILNKGVDE